MGVSPVASPGDETEMVWFCGNEPPTGNWKWTTRMAASAATLGGLLKGKRPELGELLGVCGILGDVHEFGGVKLEIEEVLRL